MGRYLNLMSIIAPKYAAKKGFEVFCSPFKIKLKPKQEQFLQTAEKSSFSAAGVEHIQVYKWGDGSKKLLLLHGWQSHTFRWIKYIFALKDLDYTIYCYDAPAHGNSSGKIINVPLYEQTLQGFIRNYGPMDFYGGHSLGAFTLLYACYTGTIEHAKGLVILGCPGNAQDFVDVYQNMLGLSKKTMHLVTKRFKALYDQTPKYFTTARFVRKVRFPGLIIHDRNDKEAPVHYAESLAKSWTNSNYIVTEGLGHKLRSPEVVDRAVSYLENHYSKVNFKTPKK